MKAKNYLIASVFGLLFLVSVAHAAPVTWVVNCTPELSDGKKLLTDLGIVVLNSQEGIDQAVNSICGSAGKPIMGYLIKRGTATIPVELRDVGPIDFGLLYTHKSVH